MFRLLCPKVMFQRFYNKVENHSFFIRGKMRVAIRYHFPVSSDFSLIFKYIRWFYIYLNRLPVNLS